MCLKNRQLLKYGAHMSEQQPYTTANETPAEPDHQSQETNLTFKNRPYMGS